MAKNLVIYYSRKGQNYVSGSIQDLPKGNTEIVAEQIRDAVGADLFQVDTAEPYSPDYMTCIDQAKKELNADARPALQVMLESVSDYDNIVVAGPCWWGTYPMAIFTHLEALDFSGKTVFPVMTHEGSGLAGSAEALKKFCPGATVGQGLAVRGGQVRQSEASVAAWARKHLI